MKKVIVFRVEDVLVKDFNRAQSFDRAILIEENKLKRNLGLDVLEMELKRKRKNNENCDLLSKESKEKWEEFHDKIMMKIDEVSDRVDRREKAFNDNEFERSKFKRGIGEILSVLMGIKERMNLEIVFVSDYRKSKVERVLWNNGLRDVKVVKHHGNWWDGVLNDCGKIREDMIFFSNDEGDMWLNSAWGIRVENFRVELEGMNGFMGKLGLKMCA